MTGSDVLATLPGPRERGAVLRVGTMRVRCSQQHGEHICGAERRICDGLQAELVMPGSVTDAGSRERVSSDMLVSRSGRPSMRARECEPHRGPSAAGQESGRTSALVYCELTRVAPRHVPIIPTHRPIGTPLQRPY